MSKYYTTQLTCMSEVRDLGNSLKDLEIITVDVINSECIDVLFTGPEGLLTYNREYYQDMFDLVLPTNMRLHISGTETPNINMHLGKL